MIFDDENEGATWLEIYQYEPRSVTFSPPLFVELSTKTVEDSENATIGWVLIVGNLKAVEGCTNSNSITYVFEAFKVAEMRSLL